MGAVPAVSVNAPAPEPFAAIDGATIASVDVIVLAVVTPSSKCELPVSVVADPAKGM